jgi:hypothetical protein
MGFECADGPFDLVATMHIGWNELKRAFLGVCDGKLVSRACFVVEDLLFDNDVSGFETRHDLVVCWDAVMVGLGLEWLYQDCIGPSVVCQHDILVSALCTDWEAAHVVGIQGVQFLLPAVQGCVGD